MKPLYLRTALLLYGMLTCYFSYSQTDCGFDERHKTLIATDSSYRKSISKIDTRFQQINALRGITANITTGVVYRIPVVVHVIHRGEAVGVGTNISNAQIQSAITSLTQFYRGTLGNSPDAEIEFQLATIDPTCATTSGIIRINGNSVSGYSTDGLITGGSGNETGVKNLSRWSNRDYYNIWIVAEINNNNGGAGIQGFAYFPLAPSSVDGAVMLYNAFGYDPTNSLGYNLKTATDENKTAIHEMGHAFSLFHSFEGDDLNSDGVADQCPANGNCTSDGDQICDTDPHRRSLSNCPTGANVCGGLLDNIVTNFMDYSSSACQDRFTDGQITRMRDAISLYRSSLTTSRGLQIAYPVTPYTPPVAACASTTGATGVSNDYAGIMNINVNGKSFESLTPRLDNVSSGYLDWTGDCHLLNELIRGGSYIFSATVYASNQEQIRAWIDYNNNGVFDNSTEQIYINSSIPSHATNYVTVNGSFTVPLTATVNTVLRMRVVEELSTVYGLPAISSACYSPTYGQTEDFHVFLSAVLPVGIESFSGKKNGQDVLLNWLSSHDQDAKEFQVEKSFDGVSFNKIGTVAAAGNISSAREYSFVDRTINKENNYYRLKLIDQQGKFEFSKIVLIKNNSASVKPLSLLSNPIQNNLEIQFNDTHPGKVQVRLTDITGKTLVTWTGENVANQRIKINISDKNLSKGVYILHTRMKGLNYTEKVIVR